MTTLMATGLQAGVWQGLLSGAGAAAGPAPRIEALLDGTALPGLVLEPVAGRAGEYALRLPLPADILSDGQRTILFRDADSGAVLAHCSFAAGEAAADLRAEVDLLRAELELLKSVVRRHLAAGTGA